MSAAYLSGGIADTFDSTWATTNDVERVIVSGPENGDSLHINGLSVRYRRRFAKYLDSIEALGRPPKRPTLKHNTTTSIANSNQKKVRASRLHYDIKGHIVLNVPEEKFEKRHLHRSFKRYDEKLERYQQVVESKGTFTTGIKEPDVVLVEKVYFTNKRLKENTCLQELGNIDLSPDSLQDVKLTSNNLYHNFQDLSTEWNYISFRQAQVPETSSEAKQFIKELSEPDKDFHNDYGDKSRISVEMYSNIELLDDQKGVSNFSIWKDPQVTPDCDSTSTDEETPPLKGWFRKSKQLASPKSFWSLSFRYIHKSDKEESLWHHPELDFITVNDTAGLYQNY